MKKILIILMVSCSLLMLEGCLLYGERGEITVGDLVYKHIKTNSDEYYCVVGLSEEGKQKSVITIPNIVNELKVKKNGFLRSKTPVGCISSNNLEIIYIEKYLEFAHTYFFKDCPKLKKIICLEFEDKVNECYDYNPQYIINNHNKNNEERKRLPVYVFPSKDYIEDEQNILYSYANIIYYIDIETVYYIDFIDNGKIENFPKNPIREGYKFMGWYKEIECVNKWNNEIDNLNEITYSDDKKTLKFYINKLYAKWENI